MDATLASTVASTTGVSSPQATAETTRIATMAAAVAWMFRNGAFTMRGTGLEAPPCVNSSEER